MGHLTLGCCKCHVVLGLAGLLLVQSLRMKMSGIKLKLTNQARDIKNSNRNMVTNISKSVNRSCREQKQHLKQRDCRYYCMLANSTHFTRLILICTHVSVHLMKSRLLLSAVSGFH